MCSEFNENTACAQKASGLPTDASGAAAPGPCACDADGNVALWQAANASQPFFVSCTTLQTIKQ